MNITSSKAISPYRQLGVVEKYTEPKKPKYGLLSYRSPKPEPEHKCNPPSTMVRVVLRLLGKPVPNGSLWRCRCGNIYEFRTISIFAGGYWTETYRGGKLWVDRGGEI